MFRLSVTDQSSRVTFCELTMTGAQFADILTAMTTTDVDCDADALHLVGTTREHKSERVPFGFASSRNRAKAKAALAPFEVDGWIGRVDDLFNGHRRCGTQDNPMQTVAFERWVDSTGKPAPHPRAATETKG